MKAISAQTGSDFMRSWGVTDWIDPGAEYFLWDDVCVFAFVAQDGFFDVHMAMDEKRQPDCRRAGAEMLKLVGHNKLRAIILPDRPRVCNYASRMGFKDKSTQTLKTINGSLAPFFIMWREPGDFYGRCDQRFRRGGK